ncbi:Protein CBR-UNC-82 [Caenorhabditis briggsae]|uniref:Protein CBR-UNC-82 n=1 Tax=Caenorhabditis briggsae TaxID=6238 RepID=A8X1G5_CAEBR|nr:Protein CBR-UNC-82 [Caenorhabditis briggsae]CAP26475.2 Protein CBR-UNC-82 [Caenorhabditis briggsae]
MPLSSFLCNAGKIVKCVRRAISSNDHEQTDRCIDYCNNNRQCIVTHEPTCSKFVYGTHPMSGAEPCSPTKKEKHRFEITKKLGSGTYGKVSLAYDHKFDREVAVKLIKKSAIESKADLVRIRREIRIMSALNHPISFRFMKYSSGGELYDYVSRCGSLPEAEARRIFRQITSAVLYCHKHRVAHRDLKLENILLDQNNNAKIADFGLSNYFADKNLLTTFCGSPLYASPEIINGTPYKGPEVDCWSLGILLYTLVYGSMPFDGRDFNRMVRQIKRGAYFEPETPSTASMLIRNMLRVNPERRATIFDIASHWWLNLEENMPVIQELPENQIIDHTPLTEREETMVVQDLADEQDVFMEFGHLSSETRRKIEDFRRRRKEAEEFNDNSPVKPPKTRKTDELTGKVAKEQPEEMRSAEKSLRGVKEEKEKPKVVDPNDPLERLRQIENRLGQQKKEKEISTNTIMRDNTVDFIARGFARVSEQLGRLYGSFFMKEITRLCSCGSSRRGSQRSEKGKITRATTGGPEDSERRPSALKKGYCYTDLVTSKPADSRAPSFVPVKDKPETSEPERPRTRPHMTASTYRIETDSLNMLMNQVLEQMEKGPVNLNIIGRIKAHPLYDTRPMVKELLESIIAAQPEPVQKQTSKVVEQQTFSRQNTLTRKKKEDPVEEEEIPAVPSPPTRKMKERPWHSVEVGFDPDEEAEHDRMQESIASNTTEVTVQDTSFEDDSSDEEGRKKTPVADTVPKTPKLIIENPESSKTVVEEEESDEDEDYSDAEMEELADEVEKKAPEDMKRVPTSENLEANPPPDPSSSPQFLDAFDRGLIKRQSKGKYQHTLINNYGRGVSTECESPTQQKKFFGGPQPSAELSPFLFDKACFLFLIFTALYRCQSLFLDSEYYAKEILQTYPNNKLDARGIDVELRRKLRMEKTSQEIREFFRKVSDSQNYESRYVGSVPPRTPPPIVVKSDGEDIDDDEEEEEDEDEEEVEETDSAEGSDFENFKPKRPIIAAVRRDDGAVVPVIHQTTRPAVVSPNSQNPRYQVASPKTSTVIQATPEKVPVAGTSAKYLVTVAELKLKQTEKKEDSKTEALLKEQLKDSEINSERRTSQTNLLFRPSAYMASDLYRRINAVTRGAAPPPPSTISQESDGKDTHESASAYIRRKNRERRQRNRTIGTAEEALRALERPSVDPYEEFFFNETFQSGHSLQSLRIHSTLITLLESLLLRLLDTFVHVITMIATVLIVIVTIVRCPQPVDITAAVSRDDRGKSTSYDPHDTSRPSYDRSYITSSNASPSYTRKFEHEQPTLNSWANDRKFEVYKTRAERDAERNTYHSNLSTTGASSYRPSSYYTSTSDRPLTGLRRPEESYNSSSTAYSRYDGRSTTPSNDHYAISSALADNQASSMENRFRPTARRVASAMTDADRRNYHRSRSMDRNKVDYEYGSNLLTRLTTPDTHGAGDYSYVNYHDSSNGRSNTTMEKDGQPRSILKNKQSADIEPRVESSYEPSSGVRSHEFLSSFFLSQLLSMRSILQVFERLRRHLSLEKSVSPQRQVASVGPHSRNIDTTSSVLDNPKKKRSLLSFNRRKTSEVRMGADGKLITNGYDDTPSSRDFKRPSSPIDRIKSLFRKSDTAGTGHFDYYNSSRAYTSSNPTSTRESYVAQYRKYPGTVSARVFCYFFLYYQKKMFKKETHCSTTRDTSSALNRYSYTPGLTDQRRHWYDDPNIY